MANAILLRWKVFCENGWRGPSGRSEEIGGQAARLYDLFPRYREKNSIRYWNALLSAAPIIAK